MDVSSLCLLHSGDLYKLGIRYSRQHLDRLEKAGKFPRRVKLTPNGRIGWLATEVHDWLRQRIENSRADWLPALKPATSLGRGA